MWSFDQIEHVLTITVNYQRICVSLECKLKVVFDFNGDSKKMMRECECLLLVVTQRKLTLVHLLDKE